MKQVYYNGIITTHNNGQAGVSMATGGKTLSEALQELISRATYYWALGYKVTIKDIRPFCTECHGSGQIRKGKRTIRYVKCPSCKGQGEGDILCKPIPVIPNNNIEITFRN